MISPSINLTIHKYIHNMKWVYVSAHDGVVHEINLCEIIKEIVKVVPVCIILYYLFYDDDDK